MQDKIPVVDRIGIIETRKNDPVVVQDPQGVTWEFLRQRKQITIRELAYRLQAQDPATVSGFGAKRVQKPKSEARAEAFRQFVNMRYLGVATIEKNPNDDNLDVLRYKEPTCGSR